MTPTYLELALRKLEEFEGSIPWMYRDAAGNVTVGVGLVLPEPAAAAHLPFAVDGRDATDEEIAAEYARVDALPMGRPALYYRGTHTPELPQEEIGPLLQRVLTGFETELRASLAGYDRYPDSVKMALLDMAYNLGPAALLHAYPRMIHAIETGNWAQAAASCERVGPGAIRNSWTRQMFLDQVAGESVLKQLGYGMVGLTASLWTRLRRK